MSTQLHPPQQPNLHYSSHPSFFLTVLMPFVCCTSRRKKEKTEVIHRFSVFPVGQCCGRRKQMTSWKGGGGGGGEEPYGNSYPISSEDKETLSFLTPA